MIAIKYKKFANDIFLNLMSNFIVIGTIQLIIFPLISKKLDVEQFGTIIALYGFNNVIVNFLGNSLNNVRLIHDNTIKEKGIFNYILIRIVGLGLLICSILYYSYRGYMSFIEIIIVIAFTILSIVKNYSNVFFRLSLNYNKLIVNNIILVIGYLFGLFVYQFIPVWSIVFLSGEIFALIHIFNTTDFLKETPEKTNSLKYLVSSYKNIASSSAIGNGMAYLDRFLISPILGSASLSMYYSVSVVSKMITMLITPITNVVLSYVSRYEKIKIRKHIIIVTIFSLLILSISYMVLNLFTPFVIKLLYPQFYEIGKKYIWIVNLSTCLSVLVSIINPYILKFADTKFQVIIRLVYGTIYLISAFILTTNFGLMGFCIASVLSVFIRWVLTLFVGLKLSNENTR